MRLGRTAAVGGAVILASIAGLSLLNEGPDEPVAGPDLGAEALEATRPKGPTDEGWRVSRVVDGDTIHVQRGGADITVRLIGIDTPETVKPNAAVECFGPEASEFAASRLDGATVTLEADPSQSPTDRYGRTLAYVWVDSAGAQRLFNLDAVLGGYAREATYAGPYAWQEALQRAEDLAKSEGRGRWSACNAD
jgi:micrococcal nuclease